MTGGTVTIITIGGCRFPVIGNLVFGVSVSTGLQVIGHTVIELIHPEGLQGVSSICSQGTAIAMIYVNAQADQRGCL